MGHVGREQGALIGGAEARKTGSVNRRGKSPRTRSRHAPRG